MAINSNVYDVTNYIDYHPAGSQIIIERCGREVTNLFARIHSNRAWDLLARYKVGKYTTISIPAPTTQIGYALTDIEVALQKANPTTHVIHVKPSQRGGYLGKIVVSDGRIVEVHMEDLKQRELA